jgi:hypothetical protein
MFPRCTLILILFWAAELTTAAQTPAPEPSPSELQKQIQALEIQMKAMMEEYQSQVRELKTQLEALQAAKAPSEPATSEQAEGLLPPAPAAPPSASLTNPAISLIPDFTYSSGNDPVWKQANAFQVREVELAFSANIDPYAKAFAALSLEGGEFNVEEAYAAFPSIGGGWTLKLGQFKADFGKQNQAHLHTWFQADQPLALRTFLGDEGLADTGVSVSHLIPTPWMSDITFEVTGGRNGTAFGGKRSDLSYLAAWRNFWDLTEASNLEAQISLTAGKNETGKGTGLGDLSVTYRYKPPASKRESFLWRTEILYDGYRTPGGLNRAWGGFSYVDWQFTRGWTFGARADYAEHPMDPRLHDEGGALVLTFYPSEFQKFRLQWERTKYAGIGTRDALVFEYGFALGPHGAHPF